MSLRDSHRRFGRLSGALVLVAACLGSARAASAENFSAGSLIVPMDTTYQDSGMFKAYGLVYALLTAGAFGWLWPR